MIQKAVEVNGEKTQQYLQLDPETKSVIHRRVTDIEIERKLKDMEKVNDIELGTQQKQQIRDGKPVELNVGGEKVSVGIDLKEPQGFKLIKGDMKDGKAAEAPLRRPAPRIPRPRDDRQEPLGVPAGGGRTI